jgi:hypothetical protein
VTRSLYLLSDRSKKNKLNTPIKESSRCCLTLTDDHNGNHTDECSSAEEAEYMAGAGNYEIPEEDYSDSSEMDTESDSMAAAMAEMALFLPDVVKSLEAE